MAHRVPAGELERWTRALLEAAGLEPDAAATVAETLIDTSLRGVDSHGVARVPVYAERLRSGAGRRSRRWRSHGRCATRA